MEYKKKIVTGYNVSTTFLDLSYSSQGDDKELSEEEESDRIVRKLSEAFTGNTKLVWLETPTNPTLRLVDIEMIAQIAHGKGALVVVDNTCAWSACCIYIHLIFDCLL